MAKNREPASNNRQAAIEFTRQIERWQKSADPEEEIAALEAALKLEPQVKAWPQVLALKGSRQQVRGALQSALGDSYEQRRKGSRADNLERAIAAYEAALTVRTRHSLPEQWAETQNNLAAVYRNRIRGERADNLERAIAAYEAALTVFTREGLPGLWATMQNNLALAYADRIRGERADNLDKAIAAYEAVLTVRTREALPQEWALSQNNLAVAYWGRIHGERADNLEKAITHLEAALTVRTREALPEDWARTQNNLAIAYGDRIRGDHADNLGKAIAADKAALTVFTREALPRDHLRSARLLGQVLLEKHEWAAASAVYAGARAAFGLLFGQGLEEDEARDLIAEVGPLFAEAAYASAQTGDNHTALALLTEGNARLLAVQLRQQSLEFTAIERASVDALKLEIRALSVETQKQGAERFRALERITALRRKQETLIAAAEARRAPVGGIMALARSVLPEGGAIVAPIITKVGGKLMIVTTTDGDVVITVLGLPNLTTETLNLLLRGWLNAYDVQHLPLKEQDQRIGEWLGAIRGLGPNLWDLLGGTLHKALVEHGVKPGARLLWLPAGALGLLPLGLAQGPDGQRLGDIYEISATPSLEAHAAAAQQLAHAPAPSLAAVINPTGDIPKLALPFTEVEGALVANYFGRLPRIMLDKSDATPRQLLEALKGKSYWHISSHGQFDWKDARQSGLLMKGDGRAVETLTVGTLLDNESSLGRPRLVTLSACETGLYDAQRNPEEFVDLPAIFMQLGATGVLATLWQVDDLATALLMTRLYQLHLEKGMAPASALKAAQAWLRDATKAELIAYAKQAAAIAKLPRDKLTQLEDALSSRRRAGETRFALVDKAVAIAKAARAMSVQDNGANARPFAHPIYWGGFVYTGM